MQISIILPTYNEKDNIIKLVNELLKINKNRQPIIEIVIVDDNSPDKTYLICQKRYKNFDNIKVILRNNIRGLAYSIREGLENSKGDYLIVMDTDFTHDPKLIPKMLDQIEFHDIVSGSRYVNGGSMENRLHEKLSFYYNVFLKLLLKTNINDNLGGFFCIKRNFLKKLSYDQIFFGYGDYFFRLLFYSKKFNAKISEIPAIYKKRTHGKSKSNFILMLFKYFFSALKLRFIQNK